MVNVIVRFLSSMGQVTAVMHAIMAAVTILMMGTFCGSTDPVIYTTGLPMNKKPL